MSDSPLSHILLVGGHLTPALAVLDYLREQEERSVALSFVGIEFTQQGNAQESHEKESVSARGIDFYSYRAVRLFPLTITNFFKKIPQFLSSLWQAHRLLRELQPAAVVSFGSYVAVPIALMAFVHRIPIITHEQTLQPGIATRLIARLADRVASSFPDTPHLPERKTVVTGNPIRPVLTQQQLGKPDWFSYTGSKPLLYITGGGQGSEVINTTVAQALPRITRDWSVIHQCGRSTAMMDYKSLLERKKRQLSKRAQTRYFVQEWIPGEDLNWILRHSVGVVSRSGANTVQELEYFQKPAVLIPLPFARSDEQRLNAKRLHKQGGAILLEQKDLTPDALVTSLKDLERRAELMQATFEELEESDRDPTRAPARIVELVYAEIDA
jgi:UDP-N-acetylglucosamine--N-acetylmuramyl-(pentapeptide) pyrophosphoryl-undecaprenol N-acetylglucosamine transferase